MFLNVPDNYSMILLLLSIILILKCNLTEFKAIAFLLSNLAIATPSPKMIGRRGSTFSSVRVSSKTSNNQVRRNTTRVRGRSYHQKKVFIILLINSSKYLENCHAFSSRMRVIFYHFLIIGRPTAQNSLPKYFQTAPRNQALMSLRTYPASDNYKRN